MSYTKKIILLFIVTISLAHSQIVIDTFYKDKLVYSKVLTNPVPPSKNPFYGIKYPKNAAKNNVSGQVEAKFVVNEDGSISDINIISKTDSSLNNEALRIIKNMKPWTPGRVDLKPVKVSVIYPINFKIE
jgi:TonB family protein